MNEIDAICWDDVSVRLAQAWVQPEGKLIALWPSPVNANACFEKAGFSKFIDFEESTWDDEWQRIVERTLDSLGWYGKPNLQTHGDVHLSQGSDLFDWFDRAEAVELSIADRVILSTHDDRFAAAVVHFGDMCAITLRTCDGHPLLWIAIAPGLAVCGSRLARAISEGRPVVRHQLQWEALVGGGSH